MVSRTVNIITGIIALIIFAVFTIGLSKSISSGFAGFKGGLPFAIIVGIVLLMALWDFYDICFRQPKKQQNADYNNDPSRH